MKIGLLQVKQALKDPRFRDILPLDLRDDIAKFLQNPGCSCNMPLYRRVIKECKKELVAYYPGSEVLEDDTRQEIQNNFTVINCSVLELESRLKALPPGRKQIAATRFQDQVTVIVNELDS